MPQVFVSYRRADESHARNVYEGLKAALGAENVFLDVENLELGSQFPQEITEGIKSASAFVLVIGPAWVKPEQLARLHQGGDWVRREVRLALKEVPLVVPVVIGGATLPGRQELPPALRKLLNLETLTLDLGRHFQHDIDELVTRIRKVAGQAPARPAAGRRTGWAGGVAFMAAGGAVLAWRLAGSSTPVPPAVQVAPAPPASNPSPQGLQPYHRSLVPRVPAAEPAPAAPPPENVQLMGLPGLQRKLVANTLVQQQGLLAGCLTGSPPRPATMLVTLNPGGRVVVLGKTMADAAAADCAHRRLAGVAWPTVIQPVSVPWTISP